MKKNMKTDLVSLEIVQLYTERQLNSYGRNRTHLTLVSPVSKFNEFKSRVKKSPKTGLSAGLNLDKLNTILSGTNYI